MQTKSKLFTRMNVFFFFIWTIPSSDMSCRSRLATLNEKLTALERRIEYIEARVRERIHERFCLVRAEVQDVNSFKVHRRIRTREFPHFLSFVRHSFKQKRVLSRGGEKKMEVLLEEYSSYVAWKENKARVFTCSLCVNALDSLTNSPHSTSF